MAFDPLLINVTSSDISFEEDLEEQTYSKVVKVEDITNNEPEDDIESYDISGDYSGFYVSIIDSSIYSRFIHFICCKERQYFSETFCDKYFSYLRFSENPEEIINLNRVDIWNIDWAYGLLFQAFLAREYNLELPCLKKRNRKVPIISEKFKRPYRSKSFYDRDPIYEELLNNCQLTEKDSCKRKSPRNQVLLHIFILDLLIHPYYKFCIVWNNKNDFTFEIKNSKAVAHIWMTIKGNDTCNYENFARGIRFKRRNSNMFTRTNKRNRCVYQFTKTAIHDYKLKRNKNELAKLLLSEALL